MKLYFSPGACSMSIHIVLNELGIKHDLKKVDLGAKKVDGEDYMSINPKGYVPALKLDNGQMMTECAVIMQYLADQNPGKNLIPHPGTKERYKCQEWLNYIAAEIHKGMSVFFMPINAESKELFTGNMRKKFAFLAKHLETNDFLMGNQYTVADAYLYTILNWTGMLKMDMSAFPSIRGYMGRVMERPAVMKSMKEEGLL